MLRTMTMVVLISSPALAAASATAAAEPGAPYRLDNGLTVILRPVSGAKEAAVVVLFNLGGDHDPPGKSGRAHLLEHLYCTAAAGETPARSFMQIRRRYAAGYNQQTGFDYTVLAGVVKPRHLAAELRDAAARMSDLRITEADLKREVPRVLVELRNMYGGIPSLAGYNHLRLRLRPIAHGGRHGGKPEDVKAITVRELSKLWEGHYKPSNALLVLAGAFDAGDVRKLIRRHFAGVPSGKAPPPKPARPQARTGTTHRIQVKPVVQKGAGVVSVGYAAPLPGSADYAPFLIVASRLFALSQPSFRPGRPPPVYYAPLDDPTMIAIQAVLPAGKDAASVVRQLDQRLQAALTPKLMPQDKLRTIRSVGMILGMTDVPDAAWRRNLYGLAFSLARRCQLKVDGKKLCTAVQRVTDADLRRVTAGVFAPARRICVIVEVAK